MKKSFFNLNIYDSNSMMKRRQSKIRWLFLLVISLAVAGYFIVPKIIQFTPKLEKVAPKQPVMKEQIIKTFPLPTKE